MEEKIKRKSIRWGFVFAVVAIIGMASLMIPVNDERGWHTIYDTASAAEANPGAGASGILSVYIMPEAFADYTQNTSGTLEAACWNYTNADDSNVDTQHTSDFGILVRARFNKTHAWDGAQFIDSYCRVRISSANLNLAADTVMTAYVTQNNSGQDYIWMNFWLSQDQAAANLNIIRDETAEITSIKLEAYY